MALSNQARRSSLSFIRLLKNHGTAVFIKHGHSNYRRVLAIVQPYVANFRRKYGGDERIRVLGVDGETDLVAQFATGTDIALGDSVRYMGERYTVISCKSREYRHIYIYTSAVLRKHSLCKARDYYDKIEQ